MKPWHKPAAAGSQSFISKAMFIASFLLYTVASFNAVAAPHFRPFAGASVGDYVWNDRNQNGTQDAGEPGILNIRVSLYTAGQNGTPGDADDVRIDSVLTDVRGFYQLQQIPVAPGGSSFYVKFSNLKPNTEFTVHLISAMSENSNSDVISTHPLNGRTALFTLMPDQNKTDVDAGIINSGINTLPLHHLDLSVVLRSQAADLYWLAENEMNTLKFTVQRSEDGQYFTSIATVPINGFINTLTTYKWSDFWQQPLNVNVLYYRIKAEDNLNRGAYSNVIRVKIGGTKMGSVWPNPFQHYLNIAYESDVNASLQVRMVDQNGRAVFENIQTVSKGENLFGIALPSAIPAGIYLLNLYNRQTGETISRQLIH